MLRRLGHVDPDIGTRGSGAAHAEGHKVPHIPELRKNWWTKKA